MAADSRIATECVDQLLRDLDVMLRRHTVPDNLRHKTQDRFDELSIKLATLRERRHRWLSDVQVLKALRDHFNKERVAPVPQEQQECCEKPELSDSLHLGGARGIEIDLYKEIKTVHVVINFDIC